QFAELGRAVFDGCQQIFQTAGPVIIFSSSGTGAGEAAVAHTLSPGGKGVRWGIDGECLPGDWRHGADPAAIEARLAQDTAHAIKAVMVVHNETSTGATSRIGDIRAAMDKFGHPALLL